MNKTDYLAQVKDLHPSPDLRQRIAALPAARRYPRRIKPWMGVCAALAVVVLGRFWLLPRLGGSSGSSGSGHDEASTFMSYAGPVFSLTLEEANHSITADRHITLDFSPWQDGHTTDIQVKDSYVLTNHAAEEQTVTLLYPFASALYQIWEDLPTLQADGETLETVLRVGSYSGGFEGTWEGTIGGSPEGSVNLDHADSWEDYKSLLSDGTCLANAMGEGPSVSSIPVTVYEFTDPYGPSKDDEAGIPNPSIRACFDLDYSKTVVLSWGFHGGRYDQENGSMIQSFSIPQPRERGDGDETYYLLVVGEDIRNLTTGGYVTGGGDLDTPSLEGCGVSVERYESDLDTMLQKILEPYWAGKVWEDVYGNIQQKVDFETWYRAFLEYLLSYGLLSPNTAERYGAGWLEDLAGDVSVIDRVFWLEVQVTIPAGGSVTLAAAMTKEGSFDYYCAHTANQGVYGYDLAPRLGSNLSCTEQTATLEDRGLIQIVRQNFGFDLENGVSTITLDPSQEYYYLEVKRQTE